MWEYASMARFLNLKSDTEFNSNWKLFLAYNFIQKAWHTQMFQSLYFNSMYNLVVFLKRLE